MSSRLERGLSPRTADYCRIVLRGPLKDAVKRGSVACNFVALTDPPQRDPAQHRAWIVEEARRFVATVRGARLEALYTVALALGLHQGELLGLSWDNVDLEHRLLCVIQQLQWIGRKPVLLPLKSGSSGRLLRVPEALRAALRRHRARQREERDWLLVRRGLGTNGTSCSPPPVVRPWIPKRSAPSSTVGACVRKNGS
ncbi:tyrosine-type recombinase/integrase [Thermomicrobium sp. CFH 73360]|uniref:tyrosine-type recombinase/integrase n=1 Tax=Thermomicrobium sp. CFH 73360 TaxID=2951987 RepID=UPI00336C2C2C